MILDKISIYSVNINIREMENSMKKNKNKKNI
jgi:hypothetical protein